MNKLLVRKCALISILLINSSAWAGPWDIATSPLFLAKTADPLITLIWDDSGSMLVEKTPESTDYANFAYPVFFSDADYYAVALYGTGTNSKMVRDPKQNPLFFDPFKTYKPWINADGTLMANATATSLWKSPLQTHPDDQYTQNNSSCKKMNLTSSSTTMCYNYTYCNSFSSCSYNKNPAFAPGDFYYNGKAYRLKNTSTNYAAGFFYSGSPAITAVNMRNNAANWYTYYRDRKNTGKAALSYALQDIPENIKIGFTTFSYAKENPSSPLLFSHAKYTGANKQKLFDAVFKEDNAGATYMREAVLNVNNYIKNTNSLWYDGTVPLSCQRAYNIVISDGGWTDGSISFSKNSDGTAGTQITGPNNRKYTYSSTASDSYPDTYSGTFADIAMEFWKTDLRSDLANNLTAPDGFKNQAFWQHIVTHGISLNDNIPADIPTSWPNVISSNNADLRYMDLWHGVLNSKGSYLVSTDFDAITNALKTFLADASNLTSTVGYINTGLTVSSYAMNSNATIYKSFFNPITWSGDIKAYKMDASANIISSTDGLLWSASEKLPLPDNRQIVTMLKSSAGTLYTRAFRKTNLTSLLTQIPTLSIPNDAQLAYLRGDRTGEGYQYKAGTTGLRVRSTALGDFINSKPVYVGAPSANYTDNNYAAFKTANASRTPVLYAGDNDGMLHGFNANTGVELFAVIPQFTYAGLAGLTSPNYSHTYGIDGTPRAGDAYFNNQWNTVLVTPLGGGGSGIFSMNITTPTNITETNAANLSGNGYWIFDNTQDKDMGFSYSEASIAQVRASSTTKKWSVVIGNGYNNTNTATNKSTTGNAVLYVLDAQNGSIIRKLDTGVGLSADPAGQSRPNGLSTPTVVDYDGDGVADYVYAGDIFGNMWKFDLRDNDPTKWTSVKLFSNTKTPVQSITAAPDVKKHASGQGVIVYFGTGKFIGSDDLSTQQDSIYGVLDNFSTTGITASKLVTQTITNVTADDLVYRLLSSNPIDWATKSGWVINLPDNELVLNKPRLSQGYLLISTYVPDPANTVCANNQKGFVYLIDPVTGGSLLSSTIDINSDGVIDSSDLYDASGNNSGNGSVISGIQINTETNSTPVIMQMDEKNNRLLVNTQNGAILSLITSRSYSVPSQRSWKKVRAPELEKKQ